MEKITFMYIGWIKKLHFLELVIIIVIMVIISWFRMRWHVLRNRHWRKGNRVMICVLTRLYSITIKYRCMRSTTIIIVVGIWRRVSITKRRCFCLLIMLLLLLLRLRSRLILVSKRRFFFILETNCTMFFIVLSFF